MGNFVTDHVAEVETGGITLDLGPGPEAPTADAGPASKSLSINILNI